MQDLCRAWNLNLIFYALGSHWWVSRRRMMLPDLQRSLWLPVEAIWNGVRLREKQGDNQGGGCSGLDQRWRRGTPGRLQEQVRSDGLAVRPV